jgi:hypothetical protein
MWSRSETLGPQQRRDQVDQQSQGCQQADEDLCGHVSSPDPIASGHTGRGDGEEGQRGSNEDNVEHQHIPFEQTSA